MRAAYGYDGNGNVTEVERNDGSREKHSYDAMNRLKRSDYYEAGAEVTEGSGYNVRNEYDGNGNVRRTTVEKGGVEEITSYAYDEMNRIKQATQGEGGSGALPIYYKYNLSGQVMGVGYPKEDADCVAAQGEGLQIMWYGYDGYGRISSVSYQKNGTLEAFESGIGYGKVTVREYLYTSGGDLEKTVDYERFDIDGSFVKNPARTVTEYGYDSAGRRVRTSYYNYAKGSVAGTLKEKHTITYDKNSGITGETIEDRYGSTLKTTEKRYVYDEGGRLTRAETDGEATEYTYDKVGNRLTQRKDGETLSYTYNGINQLTRITKDGKQQAEYRYDGRGNQVYEKRIYGEAVINGVTTPVYQTREYDFDLRNLLERAEVSTPSAVVGNVVEYEEVVTENRYDGSGQRIRREENGRETRFYYMGSGLLYTTAGDRTLVTENILGLNGGIIGSKRFSDPYGTPEEEYANRYYFYHYDIRGSVTNIVGDDGNLVKGYEYDEYGNTTDGGEESFINEVTFTGSVRDLGSGLQYMNARYYDPATGRFVSQDTYTGTPYAPWTQHLYSYCGNNPVNMVDPTGHMPIQPMAVCDGGTTRIVPEPTGSGEELVQVNGEISWWNDTYEASIYIPSSGEFVSTITSTAFGASISISKDLISSKKSKVYWYVDETRRLRPAYNGEMVPKYPRLQKGLGIVSGAISVATLGLDIANTWTADGYTNGERVVKTGIQLGEAALNAGTGYLVGKVASAILVSSPHLILVVGVVGAGLLVFSALCYNYGTNKLYEYYLEMWKSTNGNHDFTVNVK